MKTELRILLFLVVLFLVTTLLSSAARTQCSRGQRRRKQRGCRLLAWIVAWVHMPFHANCLPFLQVSNDLRSSQQRRLV
jgi:hypothetical protein